jgi:hypothetical protein
MACWCTSGANPGAANEGESTATFARQRPFVGERIRCALAQVNRLANTPVTPIHPSIPPAAVAAGGRTARPRPVHRNNNIRS